MAAARIGVSAELSGTEWSGWIGTGPPGIEEFGVRHGRVDLSAITGVFHRRRSGFTYDPGYCADLPWSATTQARLGLGGLLSAVGTWINHPRHSSHAEYLAVQLRVAHDVGLRVPPTLVTDDPAAAFRFVGRLGQAVRKPFRGHGINDDNDDETEDEDRYGALRVPGSARLVTAADCGDDVADTLHVFQQRVPRDHEVQVTVVDDRFFAARIDSPIGSADVDPRAVPADLAHRPTELPPPVRRAVTDLRRRLGLRFATVDFVVDDRGRWWFLGCHPHGRWARIQRETGLPIAAALADALERPAPED